MASRKHPFAATAALAVSTLGSNSFAALRRGWGNDSRDRDPRIEEVRCIHPLRRARRGAWRGIGTATRLGVPALVPLLLLAAHAAAQCEGGWQRFPSAQVVGVLTLAADDANGVLYGGGTFSEAAGSPSSRVGRYDGREWSPLGTGMNDTVSKLLLFDEDQGGPMPRALYAGGAFTTAGGNVANRVARWDGTAWSALGSGMDAPVLALAMFDDDGPGPHVERLYAAGSFTTADGNAANGIARWDGSAWSALSTGVDGTIRALAVFDPDGRGPGLPRLYAAGTFTTAGGVAANGIASWDGSTWSALGNGTLGFNQLGVYSLCVFDEDGTGPSQASLFAGGHFTDVQGLPAAHLARWDGTAWSSLPQSPHWNSTGWAPAVRSLVVCDEDGVGPLRETLFVGGAVDVPLPSGSAAELTARWDGTAWSALAAGPSLHWTGAFEGNYVNSMAAWDEDGPGPNPSRLWITGRFQVDWHEENFAQVARWDGVSWTWPVGGTSTSILGLAVFDVDGPEPPALYATGTFTVAGGEIRKHIAKWDGVNWTAVGDGIGAGGSLHPYPRALCSFDPDESGPLPRELVVTGLFIGADAVSTLSIAKWNGSVWSALGGGLGYQGHSLATFDADGAGPATAELYVGGSPVGATQPSDNIGRWNGTSWHGVGAGVDGSILAMTTFDEDDGGPGSATLIAGGWFSMAGGTSAIRIARWDGSSWSSLGSGIGATVQALAVFDEDGAGPRPTALFAGGSFVTAGGNPAIGIARWDGSSWSAVGAGAANVTTLAVHDDDGPGPHREALYVGGDFTTAGGVPAVRIAKWDGISWSSLGGGISSTLPYASVSALLPFDADGPGPGLAALCVGGWFRQADGLPSSNFAVWTGCGPVAAPFCAGDGSGTPCPCGNNGASGNGCGHSLDLTGANLSAIGAFSIAADSFTLVGTNMTNSTCMYLQGTGQANGGLGVAFGDGLRCVSSTIVRLGVKANLGGGSQYPAAGDARISVRGQCAAGDLRHYQVWYRNPANFCTPLTFNFTNGLSVTWTL